MDTLAFDLLDFVFTYLKIILNFGMACSISSLAKLDKEVSKSRLATGAVIEFTETEYD